MNGAREPESFRAQPCGDACACCIVTDRHEYPRFSLFGHREDTFGGACDFVAEKGFAVQGPIVVEQVRDPVAAVVLDGVDHDFCVPARSDEDDRGPLSHFAVRRDCQ